MSRSHALVHVLDHRGSGAALRASLVRDAAASMPELAHVELAVGDGPGSGLPRVARVPVGTRRAGREIVEMVRREIPVAAAWAWSLEAGEMLRDLDDLPRLIVVDRACDRRLGRRRAFGPSRVEFAAWSPWLAGLPPRTRFDLEPVRPMPASAGVDTGEAIDRSVRARNSLREALDIDPEARVVGISAVGSSPIPGRSARWDAFSIAALAVIARHAEAVVVDPRDLDTEGLRAWADAASITPVLREAPLRTEILEWVGALDAMILAGDAADDADAALLPWIAGRAGVIPLAIDQEPWASSILDGRTGRLVPPMPPPAGCSRLLPILDDPVRRARMAAAWRVAFQSGPPRSADAGGFTASLRGAWSTGVA